MKRTLKFRGLSRLVSVAPLLIVALLGARAVFADELADLTAKAEKGDAIAQFQLGQRYAAGNGVAKDEAAALAWFKKSAAQGNTGAEVSLGSIYAHGFGVPQDWAESIRWYRAAAAKGDTTAQHNLGLDYAHGHGVEKDEAEAARWFQKAADQGHARAQYNLGELYDEGRGVDKIPFLAFVYMSLGGQHENQLHIFGEAKAAELIQKRDRIKAALSSEQLAAAEKQIASRRAAVGVHPRRFGAPGNIESTRGWYVWLKWNPDTREAEVTHDPPGEVYKVRVLPHATTYRYLAYGARFDELLPGEKMNMFFSPDENHRRGYVVHFQDEISQMKGHGHAWRVQSVEEGGQKFTAQVYAGDKPLEEKTHPFELDPKCSRWSQGKQVEQFPIKAGDSIYMVWVYEGDQRIAKLITDDASLETLKKLAQEKINAEIAKHGMTGQVEISDGNHVQFMVYSTYWAQAGQLKPGQLVELSAACGRGNPVGARIPAKVVSYKNRGVYGSGVNDVMLELTNPADATKAKQLEGRRFDQLIPKL